MEVEIPKDFFKNLDYKLTVPIFKCSCGEEVLDSPENRLQSDKLKIWNGT